MVEPGFSITTNNFGIEHKNINIISKKFIEDSLNLSAKSKILDIGSAYGVAVLPIISGNPNVTIIACDICSDHLNHIKNHVKILENRKNNLLSRLVLLKARFPEFDLEEDSLSSVLASHILPFLSGDEFEIGLKKLSKFLRKGGRLYITSYSIYNNLMKDYIPIYETKKLKGEKWPGYIEDASVFWSKENPLSSLLPVRLNHLEPCLVEPILIKNNFKIEFLDFLPPDNNIPDSIKLDGREVMGLIAVKE